MESIQWHHHCTSSLFRFIMVFLTAACVCSILFLSYGFDYSVTTFKMVLLKSSNGKERMPEQGSLVWNNSTGDVYNASKTFSVQAPDPTKEIHHDHVPTILIWQRPFGKSGYGPRPNVHCGCKYTYDRHQAFVSDAVVIYCRDADKNNLPPDFPNRTVSQLYIWWCREPPTHVVRYPLDMNYRRGFFNWTMTYRRDSEVSTPWDTIENVKSFHKKSNKTLAEIIAVKNRTAVAIVGNCGDQLGPGARGRLSLIRKMQQLMPVDGYGGCFKNKLSSAEDYEAIAPHSSYILAEAFNSTEVLVKYLLYLDKNDTAYLEYLKWRSPEKLRQVSFRETEPPLSSDFMNLCVLCRRLLERQKERTNQPSNIDSVKDFFLDSNEKSCLQGPGKETYFGQA